MTTVGMVLLALLVTLALVFSAGRRTGGARPVGGAERG